MKKKMILFTMCFMCIGLIACGTQNTGTRSQQNEPTSATEAAQTSTSAENAAQETSEAPTEAVSTDSDDEEITSADSKQNPIMNYIGSYSNGRAVMKVSCLGADQASIVITWSGSVSDSSVWTMSGDVTTTPEAVTVTYSNCTKESVSYAEDGTKISDTTEYTDGSGTIAFMAADNNAYWNDSQENASDGVPFSFYNE